MVEGALAQGQDNEGSLIVECNIHRLFLETDPND